MVLLSELSTDILILVLSYLPPADKATVSRVCKWLQRFAEPMLYADIRLKCQDRYPDALHLQTLLLKLLAAPEIASCVKRFRTSPWRDHRYLRGCNRLSDTEIESVSDLARNAAIPGDEEVWVMKAKSAGPGFYRTLIISQLPNLTELIVGYHIDSDAETLGKMLLRVLRSEKSTDRLSKFQHLKRVDLCVNVSKIDRSSPLRDVKHRLSHLLPFFYLPSIEYLRMVMPDDPGTFQWPATPPCTQSLTSLSLERSSANGALLARILAVTPNLKSLECGFICEGTPVHGPTALCAEGLEKALAHVKATLEQLTISVRFLRWYDYQSEDSPPRYGIKGCLSLHELDSLVMLEVPVALLVGHSPTPQTRLTGRLPPRIRQLCLKGYTIRCANEWKGELILRLLHDHLSQYQAQPADLEILQLKFDWDEKSLDDFRKFCEAGQLNLKLG